MDHDFFAVCAAARRVEPKFAWVAVVDRKLIDAIGGAAAKSVLSFFFYSTYNAD